jgi:phosphoribosylpyrophosphate synthetase
MKQAHWALESTVAEDLSKELDARLANTVFKNVSPDDELYVRISDDIKDEDVIKTYLGKKYSLYEGDKSVRG